MNLNQMNKKGFVEATIKETNLSEIDLPKVPVNCPSQTTKGFENPCKCGAFLVPLCIVI
jgi:hypothetical protein